MTGYRISRPIKHFPDLRAVTVTDEWYEQAAVIARFGFTHGQAAELHSTVQRGVAAGLHGLELLHHIADSHFFRRLTPKQQRLLVGLEKNDIQDFLHHRIHGKARQRVPVHSVDITPRLKALFARPKQ